MTTTKMTPVLAEMHCHSEFSRMTISSRFYDSALTVEEILRLCLERGIGVLSITDHDTLAGSVLADQLISRYRLPITLVYGMEITSRHGHILAYNIRNPIRKGLSALETINRIHSDGGFAVAAHPYVPSQLSSKCWKLDFDAIEVFNSIVPNILNRKAQRVAFLHQRCGMAGSDAHSVSSFGNGLLEFPSLPAHADQVINLIRNGRFKLRTTRSRYPRIVYEKIRRKSLIKRYSMLESFLLSTGILKRHNPTQHHQVFRKAGR